MASFSCHFCLSNEHQHLYYYCIICKQLSIKWKVAPITGINVRKFIWDSPMVGREMKKSMWHIIILTSSMCLHFNILKINLKLKFTSHITREFQSHNMSGKLKLIKTSKTHSSICLLIQKGYLKMLLSLTCFLIYETICSQSVPLSLVTAESPFFVVVCAVSDMEPAS